ncbi:MAG: M48 family metalloprotease [Leptolyngbyaceae cyanobacterium SL_7_1]|nr:M48 family metalloprotease [Leptolyngbyaceae cyanobacterium SL_7_1]
MAAAGVAEVALVKAEPREKVGAIAPIRETTGSAPAILTTAEPTVDGAVTTEISQKPDASEDAPVEPAVPPIEPVPDADEPDLESLPEAIATPEEPDPEAIPETPAEPSSDKPEATQEPEEELSPAEQERLRILTEADRLWQQGQYAEAELLYRKVKHPGQAIAVRDRPAPIFDPALLPPAGQVYWREAEAGQAQNLPTRVLVPLQLLTSQFPEFIPGHLRYSEVLLQQGEEEQIEQALLALEQATTLYPEEAELMRVRVTALAEQRQYLEASIAARQFAVLNPDDPTASEFTLLADTHLDDFQDRLRDRLTRNAIGNALTGAIGFALTGNLFGPLSAIQTSVLLLRGESEIGESIAGDAAEELPLLPDDEVVAYVNEIGQRLAAVTGRTEFEYEFYVVADADLNAFALPGGKVFINAGAIAHTNSEAELAGLLAHELAHTVLSHGFQMVTQGNLTANLLQFVPYGGIATDLVVLSYSRDMERQADALATRLLATSGYAADGLQNLMITLGEETEDYPLEWLSTHPDTAERIRNIDTQIASNGYNRYAFEGVERHWEMRRRVERLLPDEPEEKPEQSSTEGDE